MKRVGDIKTAYRPYWVSQNPDLMCLRRSELLKTAWDQAVQSAGPDNTMLILMESRGIDMPGAIVPAEYLYGFHQAFPHLRHLDPIHHITREELAQDFDPLKRMLWDGHNLVVLDEAGHPAFGIANWGFAMDLEADAQGHLKFRGEFAEYAFSGQAYQYTPDPEARERFRKEFGDWTPPPPPVMSEKDAQIVEDMVARLNRAAPGRESYSEAVRTAAIDLG